MGPPPQNQTPDGQAKWSDLLRGPRCSNRKRGGRLYLEAWRRALNALKATMDMVTTGQTRFPFTLFGYLTATMLIGSPVYAGDTTVPWECSNYVDEAQTRCLNAFIEQQQDQINKLQSQLQAQQETMGKLKRQLDRQALATESVQQSLSQRQVTGIVPGPYAYTYVAPPIGLGIYFGRRWIYGAPYYYGPGFWGPRYLYGPRRWRW